MTINLEKMISLLSTNDPIDIYMDLLKSNEDFRGFIDKYKDKNTDEMIKCFNLNGIIREKAGHV